MKTILVATDLGHPADEAIAYSRALAKRLGSRIVLLNVVDVAWVMQTRDPLLIAAGGAHADWLAKLGDDLGQRMEELAAEVRKDDLEVEARVCQGQPHEMIELTADEVNADLIVVGTHSRTGIKKLVLGSVTDRLLRIVRCPVIAVPHHGSARGFGRFLVATDFSETAQPAVDSAASLALALEATVVCYHTWPHPDVVISMDFVPSFSLSDEDYAAVESDLEARLGELCKQFETKGVTATSVLGQTTPAEGILDTAVKQRVDLVVVGTHGRRGLSRTFLGSVAAKVVVGSSVPVMVVPCTSL